MPIRRDDKVSTKLMCSQHFQRRTMSRGRKDRVRPISEALEAEHAPRGLIGLLPANTHQYAVEIHSLFDFQPRNSAPPFSGLPCGEDPHAPRLRLGKEFTREERLVRSEAVQSGRVECDPETLLIPRPHHALEGIVGLDGSNGRAEVVSVGVSITGKSRSVGAPERCGARPR
jgi:hypothetical protein